MKIHCIACIAIISIIIYSTASAESDIECFGIKCPPGSIVCLFEEKSVANHSKVIGQSLCFDANHEMVLRGRTVGANPKGEVIINRYKFIGPGIYNKQRINYKVKGFRNWTKKAQAFRQREMQQQLTGRGERVDKTLAR